MAPELGAEASKDAAGAESDGEATAPVRGNTWGTGSGPTTDAQAFVIEVARLLTDLHCADVVIYDVGALSPVTRYILIASGTSDRQIKGVAANVGELGRDMGFDRFGSERDDLSTWAVLDFVEVMVHLFEPATRGHYDLEMLWGDAPKIAWRRG